MDELRFDGRAAIVTGAARGIGRAHALLLAERGASVVVADYGGGVDGVGSSHGPADEVVAEIRAAGGQAVAAYGSVAEETEARGIVDTALESFGRLDILVNNAGINITGPFAEHTVDSFERLFAVHFWGTYNMVRASWDHMVRAGYGRIVNTLSEAIFGFPGEIAYGAAKGAAMGLTLNLALEAPAHGICVNGLAPRAHTRMTPADVPDDMRKMMPPELVAPAAAYLAHESCELNGRIFVAGVGGVNSLFIAHNAGIQKPDITLEDVAENVGVVTEPTMSFIQDVSWAVQG